MTLDRFLVIFPVGYDSFFDRLSLRLLAQRTRCVASTLLCRESGQRLMTQHAPIVSCLFLLTRRKRLFRLDILTSLTTPFSMQCCTASIVLVCFFLTATNHFSSELINCMQGSKCQNDQNAQCIHFSSPFYKLTPLKGWPALAHTVRLSMLRINTKWWYVRLFLHVGQKYKYPHLNS